MGCKLNGKKDLEFFLIIYIDESTKRMKGRR
jgi:hypothetical protein